MNYYILINFNWSLSFIFNEYKKKPKDEESEMDSEIDHKITKSSRTFIFDRLEGDTDKLPNEASNEDRIFVGIDKGDVEFGKGSGKLIDYNSLEQYL